MQKDELIQMHTFLLQLRTHIENLVENNNPQEFLSYEKLNNKEKKVFHELQKVLDQMEIPAGFESSKPGVKEPK